MGLTRQAPGCRRLLLLRIVLGLLALSSWAARPGIAQAAPETEVRGLWATRFALASPEQILRLVEDARAGGFNTILAQVRGRGDALYASAWEPRSVLLRDQPAGFDPLAFLLDAAHRAGIAVHAWLNTYYVANLDDLPAAPSHPVNAHPDWLMVPRRAALQALALDPAGPGYRDLVVAASLEDRREVEGLYLSPANPGVRRHLLAVWTDLAGKYPVDGMHFDFVRFPSRDFDFSPVSLALFRDWLDSRGLPADTALPDLPGRHPDQWRFFQSAQVTDTVAEISRAVKAIRPSLLVTAAVFANDLDAEANRCQDWKAWLLAGHLDAVCPMAYGTDTALFRRQIAVARAYASGHQVWAGIGAYRLDVPSIREKIQAARDLGADGFVLFSSDSLRSLPPFRP